MGELTFLKELLSQAPGMGAAVLVVWFFLRHLEKRDARFCETLDAINADHISARNRSDAVIDRCSTALMQNTMACEQMGSVNEKMTDLLQETLIRVQR